MSLSAIPRALRQQVAQRDGGRCQYCGLMQVGQASVFHVDHVAPKSRGGLAVLDNLVLQCPCCSLHKADKVKADDPVSGDSVPLFHPLREKWDEHFEIGSDGVCHGLTPTGRATVDALKMNDALPRLARALQIRSGFLQARPRG